MFCLSNADNTMHRSSSSSNNSHKHRKILVAFSHSLPRTKRTTVTTILTIVMCFITVTRNQLECVVLTVSILQFVPHTMTACCATAVTQLHSDGHPNGFPTVCIISTKPTAKIPPKYFYITTQKIIFPLFYY